jgi:hypothetical protein
VRSLADRLRPQQYSSFRCLGRQWLDFASEAQSIPVQTSCFGIPATALAMRLTLASTPAFALASTLGLDNACFWVGTATLDRKDGCLCMEVSFVWLLLLYTFVNVRWHGEV